MRNQTTVPSNQSEISSFLPWEEGATTIETSENSISATYDQNMTVGDTTELPGLTNTTDEFENLN